MTQLLIAALGLTATMLTVKVSPAGPPDGCHKCHDLASYTQTTRTSTANHQGQRSANSPGP